MKIGDGNLPNPGKLPFLRRRKSGSFSVSGAGAADNQEWLCRDGGRV